MVVVGRQRMCVVNHAQIDHWHLLMFDLGVAREQQ